MDDTRMKTKTITQTSTINCTLEELFDFHLDSNNLNSTKYNCHRNTRKGKIEIIKSLKAVTSIFCQIQVNILYKKPQLYNFGIQIALYKYMVIVNKEI